MKTLVLIIGVTPVVEIARAKIEVRHYFCNTALLNFEGSISVPKGGLDETSHATVWLQHKVPELLTREERNISPDKMTCKALARTTTRPSFYSLVLGQYNVFVNYLDYSIQSDR